MESIQFLTTALIALAGKSRLPKGLKITDEVISEHDMLVNMEKAIQEYIKADKDFGTKLHKDSSKNLILKDIRDIMTEFTCSIKDAYMKLWENFLTNNKNNKENLELINIILTKVTNKKFKSSIELANKTPTKINNSVKNILNVSPPFASIFAQEEFEKLDKKEQMIQKNIIQHNETHTTRTDTFLDLANFERDEDMNVSCFYNNIRKVTDSATRNDYYVKFMIELITPKQKPQLGEKKTKINPLMIKVGNDWKICPIDSNKIKIREHIFMMVYIYFITNEKIKTLDEKNIIKTYLDQKNMNWITYQINEFSNKLHPNSPFKMLGFNLDPWQKETIKAIMKKMNILLDLPTSAGKTVLATYPLKNCDKVVYCCCGSVDAPIVQVTGIVLASLDDENNITKNVRHETESFSYVKYPSQPDNIIMTSPAMLFKMLTNKTIDPNLDYIILDEFHNIADPINGPYIEFILKFATYNKIPIMALSATIPNFAEVKLWMENIVGNEIFAVSEKKRFFNQKRFYVKNGKLEQINPLEHMTSETLMDPAFTQIGLYPKEIMMLRDRVQKIKHSDTLVIDEKTPSMVTLDKLHILEGKIFEHLKNSPEIHETIFKKTNQTFDSNDNLVKNIYGLFQIFKECKEKKMMPVVAFRFESESCLEIYHSMINMLREMEALIYPSFNRVNEIIQAYESTLEKETKKLDVEKNKDRKKGQGKSEQEQSQDKSEMGQKSIEDLIDQLKSTLYGSPTGVKYQLEKFYENFVNTPILPGSLDLFNKKYGSNFTEEIIIDMRMKHVESEMEMYNCAENLRLRNIFMSHPNCRLMDTTVSYDEMKKIKRSVSLEITRDAKKKFGINAQVQKIGYDHPFMLGIERGIICCNQLMPPALQRICQQLINTHPFVTMSDKSLSEGINYPIRTVMLLGQDNEKISNTLAHQSSGRAGRRGLDSEGYIIYAGVDISSILIPKYTIVRRNSVDKMEDILQATSISDAFRNYITNEIRPDVPEPLYTYNYVVDIDALAEELFRSQSTKDITLNVNNDNEDADTNEYTFSSTLETLEEIKVKLMTKYTFKAKVSKPIISNTNIEVETNVNTYVEPEPEAKKIEINFAEVDDWEIAADADEELAKSKKMIAEAESSFM
jgi:hypothetical protein